MAICMEACFGGWLAAGVPPMIVLCTSVTKTPSFCAKLACTRITAGRKNDSRPQGGRLSEQTRSRCFAHLVWALECLFIIIDKHARAQVPCITCPYMCYGPILSVLLCFPCGKLGAQCCTREPRLHYLVKQTSSSARPFQFHQV